MHTYSTRGLDVAFVEEEGQRSGARGGMAVQQFRPQALRLWPFPVLAMQQTEHGCLMAGSLTMDM